MRNPAMLQPGDHVLEYVDDGKIVGDDIGKMSTIRTA